MSRPTQRRRQMDLVSVSAIDFGNPSSQGSFVSKKKDLVYLSNRCGFGQAIDVVGLELSAR